MRSAACASARFWSAGKASCAALSSAAGNSNAATDVALTRSNSAVYSSTAASPRTRTSVTMLATEASIASSSALSRAVSFASADANPGSSVSRRRISGIARHRLGDRVEDRLNGIALELERGRIDDEPRADRTDLLDDDQVVGLQRLAGADQVDDQIGQPHQRRELHRAVQLDQIDMDSLGAEMRSRGADVLGGDLEAGAALHGAGVIEIAARCDDQAAAADRQVERLIKTFSAVLEQHILAGDAQVCGTMLNIGRDIGRAHDDKTQVGAIARQDQLARSLRIVFRSDAGRRQQRQRLIEDAPAGERYGEREHGSRERRILAHTGAHPPV